MSDQQPIEPPPWQLTGRGYVITLSCSQEFGAACARDIPGLAGRARGGLGALMFVDYATSNVGPYRELLLCPGVFDFDGRRAAAVTHIWVSSMESVISGRHNWGLPKCLAYFDTQHDEHGQETCRIQLPDHAPLMLHFAQRGPRIPMGTGVLPRAWRTLEQPWEGRYYRTCIRARARARLARITDQEIPSDSGFPDFSGQKPRIGLYADRFDLTFPHATSWPMEAATPDGDAEHDARQSARNV